MKHLKLFEEYHESGQGMNLSDYLSDVEDNTVIDGMNVRNDETGEEGSIQDHGLEEDSLPGTLNIEDSEDGSEREEDINDLTVTEEI